MAKTTIHSDYIPDNAITSTKIAENSIGAREIATNAITTLYVADGSVTTVKIADDAITSAKLDTNIDIAGTISSGAITSSGNLTVGGNVTLSSTTPLLYLANTTSGTGKTWRFSSASNGKLFITQEGVIDAVTLDHTSGNATFAGTISSGTVTVDGEVAVSPSTGTSKVRLTSQGVGSEVFTVNGQRPGVSNTGFAIRNETDSRNDFMLDGSGNATFAGTINSGTLTVAGSSSGTVDALIITNTDTTNNGLSIGVDSSENAFFWNGSNTSMNFATNNTLKMVIDATGNVGIGTTPSTTIRNDITSAEKALQIGTRAMFFADGGVTTDLQNNSHLTNSNTRVAMETDLGSLYQQYQGVHKWFNAASVSAGATQTMTERMRIASDGKLLINNTDNVENGLVQVHGTKSLVAGIPQGLLQVSDKTSMAAGVGGGINFTGAYLSSGTHTSFASIEANKANGTSGNYGGDLVFKTRVHGGAQSERMRIDSSGNVGIGVSDPDALLEVAGSARFAQENAAWSFDDTVNGRLGFVKKAGLYPYLAAANGMPLIIGRTNANPITSNVSSQTLTESARFDSSGSFEFNTTANLGFRYFIINQGSGADGGFILRVGNSNKWQNSFNSAGQLQWYSYTASAITTTMHGNGHVSILGSGVDRGAALNIGGTSSTARVLPQTDNVGYIGDSSFRWQAIYAVNGSIQTSDEREKTEIKETTLGLDFIKDLKPVSYKWIDGEQQDKGKDEREHQGLIAQQVAETVEKHGIDKNNFGGLDIQKTEKYDEFYGMSYDQFVAPLIKAIQEQQTIIDDLKSRLDEAGL